MDSKALPPCQAAGWLQPHGSAPAHKRSEGHERQPPPGSGVGEKHPAPGPLGRQNGAANGQASGDKAVVAGEKSISRRNWVRICAHSGFSMAIAASAEAAHAATQDGAHAGYNNELANLHSHNHVGYAHKGFSPRRSGHIGCEQDPCRVFP